MNTHSEQISAGQNQQLEKMTPADRMTVLASHDFGHWVDSQYPNASTSEKLKMKKSYIGGFFNGMDRACLAFNRRDSGFFYVNANWLIPVAMLAGVLIGYWVGFMIGAFK